MLREPWHTWPDEFKFRKPEALDTVAKNHRVEIDKVKWFQFIFSKQWVSLKNYCNKLDVSVFGDLPFYISYDSADVWTEPEIFDLDESLQMKNVSGVRQTTSTKTANAGELRFTIGKK